MGEGEKEGGGDGETGREGDEGQGRGGEKVRITTHRDLDVYRMSFEAAMRIFDLTKTFPKEETYSLTDQIRRASRSVCSNVAEAWRKRRYEAAFVSKLNDAEAEAAETQVWLDFSAECKYLDAAMASELKTTYESILGKLVTMIQHPEQWIIKR